MRHGDEGYAREELVAELGSAFLCADLGITPEVREDHAAYIASLADRPERGEALHLHRCQPRATRRQLPPRPAAGGERQTPGTGACRRRIGGPASAQGTDFPCGTPSSVYSNPVTPYGRTMITPHQCRMARAALDLGVRDLARIADVSPNTVARMERGSSPSPHPCVSPRGTGSGRNNLHRPRCGEHLGGAGVRLGNEGAKSSMGKLFEALWNLPDLRTQPEKAYGALLDILDRYLEIIKEEERQPDAWERLDLNDALNALNRPRCFCSRVVLTARHNAARQPVSRLSAFERGHRVHDRTRPCLFSPMQCRSAGARVCRC